MCIQSFSCNCRHNSISYRYGVNTGRPVPCKSCHNCLVSLAVALLSNLDLTSAIILPTFWVMANAESALPCPVSRPTCVQNFTPLAFSAAEKSVTVQRKNKCVSRLAIRIPHHTALSNDAARNSLPTVVTIDDNRTNRRFNSGLFIHDGQQYPPIHSGPTTYAAAPVTPHEPIFTKRGEDLSG